MAFLILAAACSGLFAGAAIYVNAVEHPARMSCGTELALREFAPSCRRGTVMQASLATFGCVTGLASAWARADLWLGLAAVLLGLVVPSHWSRSFPRTSSCSTLLSTRAAS
jgi:hypothetical protein